MFHVGQKVVCVDDSPSVYGDPSFIKAGKIYTIREIKVRKDGCGVKLAEVDVPHQPQYWGWHATRFRPIQERKTDISIFTAMLNNSPAKVRA